jgi:hypothetical protein
MLSTDANFIPTKFIYLEYFLIKKYKKEGALLIKTEGVWNRGSIICLCIGFTSRAINLCLLLNVILGTNTNFKLLVPGIQFKPALNNSGCKLLRY